MGMNHLKEIENDHSEIRRYNRSLYTQSYKGKKKRKFHDFNW